MSANRIDTNTGNVVVPPRLPVGTPAPTGGSPEMSKRTVTFVFGSIDGTTPLTAGLKVFIRVPYGGSITKVVAYCDPSGSIVFDLWKKSSFKPTVADTITASAKPTISTGTTYTDSTLTGWTTLVTTEDILGANIDSASGLTWALLQIDITLAP